MKMKTPIQAMLGATLLLGASAPAMSDEVVIATTGGLMRNMLEEHMYLPFQEQTGTEVIPFDIEVPDQWARTEGMVRSGNIEFDIVTATGPDLVDKADILLDIPCADMPNVVEYALDGACEGKGVARTTGGMVLTYNSEVFADEAPRTGPISGMSSVFPDRAACPTRAIATGGCRPWHSWRMVSPRKTSSPWTSTAPMQSWMRSVPTSRCGGRPGTRFSRSCATTKSS
jgi:hypothetical protein